MEAGPLRDVLTLLLGLATGVLSALFGIGGAIVSNPGLRALGAAPLVAVGTTLPSILPGAISGTLRYQRERMIDWRLVTAAAAAGLLAVVGGSLLSHAVPGEGHLLLLLIAVLLAFTAWRTAVTPPTAPGPPPAGGSDWSPEGGSAAPSARGSAAPPSAGDGDGGERPLRPSAGVGDGGERPLRPSAGVGDGGEHPIRPSATLPLRGTSRRRVGFSRAGRGDGVSPANREGEASPRSTWMAAGIGVVAGLLSGLLGIGGGVIMVPAFTELLHLPLKSAIATSLVCVGIFGVPATITHALLGDIDWRLAVLLTIGVVPGARVGASITIHTAERRLRLAIGCFLAVVALVYFVTETRALFQEL
jgi:uncharacterized membrane protein YfcA